MDGYPAKRDWKRECKELEAENARLREELDAAHVDAKRYRKIRSECGFGQHNFSVAISTPYSWELARTGEELDAAIDDAVKENGK